MNASQWFNSSNFSNTEAPTPKPAASLPSKAETYSEQTCEHCGSHWRKGSECSSCFRPWAVDLTALLTKSIERAKESRSKAA